jgi:hypothetical protein
MPSSGIIDLAIGLIFVFGVTAALVSVFTELVSRFIGLRGAYLLTGLRELVDGGETGTDLGKAETDYEDIQGLIRHSAASPVGHPATPSALRAPLAQAAPSITGALLGGPILSSQGVVGQIKDRNLTIKPAKRGRLHKMTAGQQTWGVWRQRRSLPSYFSADSFAEAVIDLVVPDAAGETTMATIQHNVGALPDGLPFRSSLQALVKNAGDDVGQFRTSVERWYDDHMSRVSGWYKRHVAIITLALGAILIVLLNINALTIGRTLYSGSTISAAVNAVAVKNDRCAVGTSQRACLANLAAQLSAAAHSGPLIGWGTVRDCQAPGARCNWMDQRGLFSQHGGSFWQFVLVLVGFFLMIIAIVPGAQFWFGLLGKIGVLRLDSPGIVRAVSVPAPKPEPEPSVAGAGAGGAGTRPPPPSSGPSGFFEWFRRVLAWLRRVRLRRLARRHCNVTGFVNQQTADATASARRRQAEQALVGGGWPALLELPEGFPLYEAPDEEIPRHEAAARQVTLEWQLSDPQLLLLARVCDAVDALMRQLNSPAGQPELPIDERVNIRKFHPVVTLRPVPKTARRLEPDLFPWRVVIEAGEPATLAGQLGQYANWYGVGVHVTKGRPVKRTGACIHGGGAGMIGGIVQIGNKSYGLTCSHVIGEDCPGIRTPLKGKDNVWSPDAVLLPLDGPCLTAPKEPWQPVSPVSWTETNKLVKARAVACMHNARGRLRTGNMQSPTLLASFDDGSWVEFPTIEIQRRPAPYPPRPFSKPGDSGTWVTLRDAADQWVGMVVGGNPGGNTYCHLSGPLLRLFEILLSDARPPPKEEKDWFEGKDKVRAVAKMTLSGSIKYEQH